MLHSKPIVCKTYNIIHSNLLSYKELKIKLKNLYSRNIVYSRGTLFFQKMLIFLQNQQNQEGFGTKRYIF